MAEESTIRMRGPQGCAPTLSLEGREIRAEKGVFVVPASARETLERHGFKVVEFKS